MVYIIANRPHHAPIAIFGSMCASGAVPITATAIWVNELRNIMTKLLARSRLLSGTNPQYRGSTSRCFRSVSTLKSIDAIVKAAVAIEMTIDRY